MTQPSFRTSKEAREAGWHSRRHETPDAHLEAREIYQAKARPAARITRRKRRTTA